MSLTPVSFHLIKVKGQSHFFQNEYSAAVLPTPGLWVAQGDDGGGGAQDRGVLLHPHHHPRPPHRRVHGDGQQGGARAVWGARHQLQGDDSPREEGARVRGHGSAQ